MPIGLIAIKWKEGEECYSLKSWKFCLLYTEKRLQVTNEIFQQNDFGYKCVNPPLPFHLVDGFKSVAEPDGGDSFQVHDPALGGAES